MHKGKPTEAPKLEEKLIVSGDGSKQADGGSLQPTQCSLTMTLKRLAHMSNRQKLTVHKNGHTHSRSKCSMKGSGEHTMGSNHNAL